MRGPQGKHIFGMVKVGEKGQIVIPVEARKVFNIQPGDSLMLVGDEKEGLAIITNAQVSKMLEKVFEREHPQEGTEGQE